MVAGLDVYNQSSLPATFLCCVALVCTEDEKCVTDAGLSLNTKQSAYSQLSVWSPERLDMCFRKKAGAMSLDMFASQW